MQTREAVAKVLAWRWTPFFGIVGATLLYIVLAIVLVPSELEAKPEGDKRRPVDLSGAPASTEETSSFAGGDVNQPLTHNANRPGFRELSAPIQTAEQLQTHRRRGFSPPLDRPEPPPVMPDPIPSATAVASTETAASAVVPEEEPRHPLLRRIDGLRERFQQGQGEAESEPAAPDGMPPSDPNQGDNQQNSGLINPGGGELPADQ